MARRLAAAVSHAAGLSGIPEEGHCWTAASKASCAKSSARPTSRTMRVSPAMTLPASIFHTASMARCESESIRPDHITPQAEAAIRLFPRESRAKLLFPFPIFFAHHGGEIPGFKHQPDLDLRFARHRVRAALHPLNGFFQRPHLPEPEAGNQFLGFGKGAVDHRAILAFKAHPRAFRRRMK